MRLDEFTYLAERADLTCRTLSGPDLLSWLQNQSRRNQQALYDQIKYLRVSALGDDETHITAWSGGKLVGDLELQLNPYDPTMVWLKHVSTRTEFQNQGVASMMLRSAMAFCQEHRLKLSRSSATEMGAQYLPGVFERLKNEFPDVVVIDSKY